MSLATGQMRVAMNSFLNPCAIAFFSMAISFALVGCCDEGESDSVYTPSICQMKFYKGGRTTDLEVDQFLNYLEENRENLIHRPYLIEGSVYAKGDCYFLQRQIYIDNRWTLRSGTEYNNWPFDPD